MNKNLEEYITKRCENELENDNKYMEIQSKLADAYKNNNIEQYSLLTQQIQLVVETISYRAAIKDSIEIMH